MAFHIKTHIFWNNYYNLTIKNLCVLKQSQQELNSPIHSYLHFSKCNFPWMTFQPNRVIFCLQKVTSAWQKCQCQTVVVHSNTKRDQKNWVMQLQLQGKDAFRSKDGKFTIYFTINRAPLVQRVGTAPSIVPVATEMLPNLLNSSILLSSRYLTIHWIRNTCIVIPQLKYISSRIAVYEIGSALITTERLKNNKVVQLRICQ